MCIDQEKLFKESFHLIKSSVDICKNLFSNENGLLKTKLISSSGLLVGWSDMQTDWCQT